MKHDRSYAETGRVLSLSDFPDVEFIELETGEGEPQAFVVSGSHRGDRETAAKRFEAAMIEFGCRFGDMEFHDVDDLEHLKLCLN
jgi:hypothetical protein